MEWTSKGFTAASLEWHNHLKVPEIWTSNADFPPWVTIIIKIQHLHCHILHPAIWFQLFDVGLLKKPDSTERILSLMQHVKSCVSEMLVYRTFWNLKGGLVKKQNNTNQTVLKCLLYLWLHQLPLPNGQSALRCTVSHLRRNLFLSLCRQWTAEKEQYQTLPTPAEHPHLCHTPQGRILS